MNEKFKKKIGDIKGFIEKITIGSEKKEGDDGLDGILLDGVLTRQKLLDSIVDHFNQMMVIKSTNKGLLFDTSFTIYMNEDDYHDHEQSFGFTVKEAVNTFHEIIIKKKSKYPDYRPHARYWEFQFVPFIAGNTIECMRKEVTEIPRGVSQVISFLLPTKGQDATSASGLQRATVTVHRKDSFTMSNLAFNSEALSEVSILARDRFQVNFNGFRKLEKDALSDEQREGSGLDARAVIMISGSEFLLSNGRLADAIFMNSDNLLFSGRGGIADTTGGIPVVRINSDKVMDNQLRLSYNSDSHKLYFWSQSEVKLGERTVNPSVEKELYENCSILINGNIRLTITKIKKD